MSDHEEQARTEVRAALNAYWEAKVRLLRAARELRSAQCHASERVPMLLRKQAG